MTTDTLHPTTELTASVSWGASLIWVDVFVPEHFRLDCETCYSALNDTLAPHGGTASALDIWEEESGLVLAQFERHLSLT